MRRKFLYIFLGVCCAAILLYISPSPSEEISLQEKLGQLLIIGFEGTELTSELRELLSEIHPGGVLLLERNIKNPEQLKKLIRDLQQFSEKDIGHPLFIAVDQEGGEVSRISWVEDTAQLRLRDPSHAFQVGKSRGEELKELGVNMNLAPVLDTLAPSDFLYGRSFQRPKDEALGLVQALLKGLESQGIISVPKHFPGYGSIPVNPEIGEIPRVPYIPDTTLFQEIFAQSNPPFVMISHIIYEDIDGNPFPFSQKGMRVVKEFLGEDVMVMSDDLLSRSLVSRYELSDIGVRALQGGVQVLLLAGYPDPDLVPRFYEGFWNEVEKREDLHLFIISASETILRAKQRLLSQ